MKPVTLAFVLTRRTVTYRGKGDPTLCLFRSDVLLFFLFCVNVSIAPLSGRVPEGHEKCRTVKDQGLEDSGPRRYCIRSWVYSESVKEYNRVQGKELSLFQNSLSLSSLTYSTDDGAEW